MAFLPAGRSMGPGSERCFASFGMTCGLFFCGPPVGRINLSEALFMMKRSRRMPSLLVALSAALLAAGALLTCPACSRKTAAAGKAGGDRAVPVTAAEAVRKSMPLEMSTFGSVEAFSTVAVESQVTGTLATVHFQKGEEVKKDELLFTIDAAPYKAACDQAQANVERDSAIEANARIEAERQKALLTKGMVAQSDADKAVTDAASAAAALRASTAALENARLQYDHCFIKSPIDGKAGNILVNAGNLVKANDVPLVTINQVRPVEVRFAIPQRDLPIVRKYMAAGKIAVRAAIAKEATNPEVGELTFLDNEVDRGTGTVTLRATFDNKDERLWPGQYVLVTMTLTLQPDLTVVPSSAIQAGAEGAYVFVIDPKDSTAKYTIVTIRRTAGDEVIVDSGLAAGQKVVTAGQLRLVDGTKVEVREDKTPKTAKPEGAGA